MILSFEIIIHLWVQLVLLFIKTFNCCNYCLSFLVNQQAWIRIKRTHLVLNEWRHSCCSFQSALFYLVPNDLRSLFKLFFLLLNKILFILGGNHCLPVELLYTLVDHLFETEHLLQIQIKLLILHFTFAFHLSVLASRWSKHFIACGLIEVLLLLHFRVLGILKLRNFGFVVSIENWVYEGTEIGIIQVEWRFFIFLLVLTLYGF